MAVTLSVPGPPMTLGNMRSLGVRSLMCELCHHKVTAQLLCHRRRKARWRGAPYIQEVGRPNGYCDLPAGRISGPI